MSSLRSVSSNLDLKCPRNVYEMNNESMVFQQNDLFPSAFPCMEEIRRQGRLCDVVLKVTCKIKKKALNYIFSNFRLMVKISVLTRLF